MHISKLSLINYRNFVNARLHFNKGINTIIGENGSGKTNIFRAIRLLLDDNFIRQAHRLEERDFHRGLGEWRGHWIIISLEFEELSDDEAIQALFLHGTGIIEPSQAVETATYNLIFRPNTATRLKFSQIPQGDSAALNALRSTITLSDYETIFTGRSTCDFNDENIYRQIVGDFENVQFPPADEQAIIGTKLPKILSVAREICFTFVQALRDVVSDFQNNRTNPLLTLLKSKSGEIDPTTFEPKDSENFWFKLARIVLTTASPVLYVRRNRWAGETLTELEHAGVNVSHLSKKLFLKVCNTIEVAETDGLTYLRVFFDKLFETVGVDYRVVPVLLEHHECFFQSSQQRIDRLAKEGTAFISEIEAFRRVFEERQGITVSTIHGIKGDEYDCVIAYALLEGFVPHFASTNPSESASKLLYVVSSRARKNLHLISERGRLNIFDREYVTTKILEDYDYAYHSV